MITLGRIGETVIHRDGRKGTIVSNKISNGNCIKVIRHGSTLTTRWNVKNITNIHKVVKENEADWCFHSTIEKDIDWNLLYSELSYAKPLLLVEIEHKKKKEQFILVHQSLIHKAEVLGYMVLGRPYKESVNAYKVKEPISHYINWAKKIKNADWPTELVRKSTIYATYLKV